MASNPENNQRNDNRGRQTNVIALSILGAAAVGVIVYLLATRSKTGEANDVPSNSHVATFPAGTNLITIGGAVLEVMRDTVAIDQWLFEGEGGWGSFLADLAASKNLNRKFYMWSVNIAQIADKERTRYTYVPGDLITQQWDGKSFNLYGNAGHTYARPMARMIPIRIRIKSARIYYRPDWLPASRKDWRAHKGQAQGTCGIVSTWEFAVGNSREGCVYPGGSLPPGWEPDAVFMTATRCDFPLMISSTKYKWGARCKDIQNQCLQYLLGILTANSPDIFSKSANGFGANKNSTNWINGRPDNTTSAVSKYVDFQGAWDHIMMGRPIWSILDPTVGCPVTKDLATNTSMILPQDNAPTTGFSDDDSEPTDSATDEEVVNGYVGPASNISTDKFNEMYSWFYLLPAPGATWYIRANSLINRVLDRAYWMAALSTSQVYSIPSDFATGRVAQIFNAGGCRATKKYNGYKDLVDCTLWYVTHSGQGICISDPWRWPVDSAFDSPTAYGNQLDNGVLMPPIITGAAHMSHAEVQQAMQANGDTLYVNDHLWQIPAYLLPAARQS